MTMLTPYLTLQRKRRRNSLPFGKIGFGCGLTVSILLIGLAAGVVLGYMDLVQDLPSLDSLPIWLDPHTGRLNQPTRLYDRTGEHLILTLQNPVAAGSQYLTVDSSQSNYLPETLVQATLAALDTAYWDHSGYSLKGMNDSSAHPTLVQRFIFETLLSRESPGLRRNLRERLLAAQATERFGKQLILEWYLNSTRYGPWVFGADAASRVFFNKPAAQLTNAEAAYLVALTAHPQADPWDYPQSVQDLKDEIIQEMQRQGWISVDEAQIAQQTQLQLHPENSPANMAPEFSAYVLMQIQSQFPTEDFERGGWKIVTTLDFDLQQQVNCTILALAHGSETAIPGEAQTSPSCKAAQLLPSLTLQDLDLAGSIDAAVLIQDPNNGQILAMLGDVLTPRPAGTLLNPVIYLAAFSRGISPGSLVWDIPVYQVEPDLASQGVIQYNGPMRMRTALANDYYQPVRSLYNQLGENVIQVTTDQLGLRVTPRPDGPPADYPLLEDSQVPLLDIVSAYAMFSNQGVSAGRRAGPGSTTGSDRISPASVIRLEDQHQSVWLDWTLPETRPVITPQLAFLMNHVLSDEIARWLSLGHPNPLEIGRPAGAKIGVHPSAPDQWTVGYTPFIATGVWIDGPASDTSRLPSTLSAGIWHALMQYANQDKPVDAWEIPPGIIFIDICDPSGFLPTAFCPTIVTEVFLQGSEPSQPDFLYRAFQVNRETGRLATVFTPPELIEEKVYMVVPLEAEAWAKEANLPSPPEAYDIIYLPPSVENANISRPDMFAHVSGEVEFTGTASGPNFDYFRLQIGQGLNPQVWVQVDEDSYEPVEDDLLGVWDSTGLSGLYAVQLLVVGTDQRVERAIMQVTVDNEPPAIQILNPVMDQVIERSKQPYLILNAQVNDNLEIGRVEFFINGDRVISLSTAPYYISWPTERGEQVLLVRGIDLAGNESEASIRFEVK
jgi:membrane peptidoglycan carboxypeptidase